MLKKVLLIIFASALPLLAQINVEQIGHLDVNPGNHKSDIWGYVDSSGTEYAIIDGWDAVYFVNLADPANPVSVGSVSAPPSIWRDIRTHGHYAYIVTEGSGTGEGMQIVDLSDLPNSVSLVNTYTTTFTTAHNISIENGYAYVIGTSGIGGMHILDLADPVNPVEVSYYTQSNYIHDVYVWNDSAIASAADSFDLIDLTDKANPVKISESAQIPGIYAHQGWMTEDKRYFYATDEFNERDIIVYDLQDRETWDVVKPSFHFPTNTRMHNLFIKGDYAHCAYYENGYVVLDISDPENPWIAGQYDTFPTDNPTFSGAWGCYPYLPSGLVLISDTHTGLYVMKFTPGDVAPMMQIESFDQYYFSTAPFEAKVNVFDNNVVNDVKCYYRIFDDPNSPGNWSMLDIDSVDGTDYFFNVPGANHQQYVDYYFAAVDDSQNVATLPAGGSGLNPIGIVAPSLFFRYQVVIAGVPVLSSFNPTFTDTTIIKGGRISFTAEVLDTTNLPISIQWYWNNVLRSGSNNYSYSSGFSPAGTIDTVKLIGTNGFIAVEREWYISVDAATSVDEDIVVTNFKLNQNYPNPFNPTTVISFDLPDQQEVNLEVFNLLGQKIKTIIKGSLKAGRHSYNFDARNLSAGIYLAVLRGEKINQTIKMTLLK